MVKTFPLDMLLSLGIGMIFSIAQGEKENEKSLFASTYFLVGLAFHFVVVFGIALVAYLLHPDWMLMYLTSKSNFPAAYAVYVFLGYFAMYVLGFLLVRVLRGLGRKVPWAAFAALLVFIVCFIGFNFHRLWYVGDFESYVQGSAKTIVQTSLLPLLVAGIGFFFVALGVVLFFLRKRLKPGSA